MSSANSLVCFFSLAYREFEAAKCLATSYTDPVARRGHSYEWVERQCAKVMGKSLAETLDAGQGGIEAAAELLYQVLTDASV